MDYIGEIFSRKVSKCHNMTFAACIFERARFYADDAEDASAITLLLKVLPFLIIVEIVSSLAFCGG